MAKTYAIGRLPQLLETAKTVLIILPQELTLDHLSAGLSLHLVFSKIGKRSRIFAPQQLGVEHNRLIGVDQVVNEIANRNLVITWPYPPDTIERVFTEVDKQSGKFQVIVEPTEQAPNIDHQLISFDYRGVNADALVMIGSKYPNDLGASADDIKSLWEQVPVVRIDRQAHPEHLQAIDVIDAQASSLSEIVFNLLQSLSLQFDQDIATNILAGIEFQTNNLTERTTSADTFEVVAGCLRAGAIRGYAYETGQQPAAPSSQEKPREPENTQTVIPPQTQEVSRATEETEGNGKSPTQPSSPVAPANPSVKSQFPNPQWLVPKIFKQPKSSS